MVTALVFASGLTFLISMLLLKFSHSVPTFGKLPLHNTLFVLNHVSSRGIYLLRIVTGWFTTHMLVA